MNAKVGGPSRGVLEITQSGTLCDCLAVVGVCCLAVREIPWVCLGAVESRKSRHPLPSIYVVISKTTRFVRSRFPRFHVSFGSHSYLEATEVCWQLVSCKNSTVAPQKLTCLCATMCFLSIVMFGRLACWSIVEARPYLGST